MHGRACLGPDRADCAWLLPARCLLRAHTLRSSSKSTSLCVLPLGPASASLLVDGSPFTSAPGSVLTSGGGSLFTSTFGSTFTAAVPFPLPVMVSRRGAADPLRVGQATRARHQCPCEWPFHPLLGGGGSLVPSSGVQRHSALWQRIPAVGSPAQYAHLCALAPAFAPVHYSDSDRHTDAQSVSATCCVC